MNATKNIPAPSLEDGRPAGAGRKRRSLLTTALVLAVIIAVPALLDQPFYRNIISLIFLWGAMAGAWNILGGYAGKFSLGNAAFFGTGAYTSAILFTKLDISPWIGMLAGMVLSVILALLLGLITLRLKGKFFALCTIAFISLMEIAAVHLRSLTSGAEGLLILGDPSLKNMMFENDLVWVYIFLGFTLLVYFLSRRLEASPLGYRWTALRENEDAAEALGVNTLSAKLSSFAISAALTSIGGSLYAQYTMFIEPIYVFGMELSIQFALYAIIGGMGSALGPIMGAAIMTPLEIFLRSSLPELASGASLALYALMLIVVVLFIPRGLVPEVSALFKRIAAKTRSTASAHDMEAGNA